ncbi:MAG: DUF86 domain-containing protein [Planctomycetes bacterium]|nr:DUF86 domain-containing protein [Planctomycetota bacterium]
MVSLRQMLEYAETSVRLATGRSREDLDKDEMFGLALTRAVEVIGEAAGRVSQASRDLDSDIPWHQISGTRNRLIHGYDQVDYDRLWNIVQTDVPELIERLKAIVEDD